MLASAATGGFLLRTLRFGATTMKILSRLIPFLLSSAAILAQCDPEMLTSGAFRGTNNSVSDMRMWDPDGAGPEPEVVVMGGWFTVAGTAACDHIVAYDPVGETWVAIGSGLPPVRRILVMANGDLVALLHSTYPSPDTPERRVMRWDGASWSQLGVDFDNWVSDVVALPGGDLLVGGGFLSVGGAPMEYLSRWNGTSWQPFANGAANALDGDVRSIAVRPNGNVIVGGTFTNAGSVAARRIAEWDGANWTAFGTGIGGNVNALLVHPSGDVYAGGQFSIAGTAISQNMARWDGTSWSSMLSANIVSRLRLTPGGNVMAFARYFVNTPGVALQGPAEWNGSAWVSTRPFPEGPDEDPSTAVFLPNGDELYAGSFDFIGYGSDITYNVARKSAGSWSSVGDGAGGVVRSWLRLANGDLVVGGDFQAIGGIAANRIARWDGLQWHPYGTGLGRSLPTGFSGESVNALAETDSGELVIAGDWRVIDGQTAQQLLQWNGTAWASLGGFLGLRGEVHAMKKLASGDIVVGGGFSAGLLGTASVALWDGAGFYDLGAGLDGVVRALEVLPGGDLIAVGEFTQSGSNILNVARWDGSSWQPMGDGINGPVHAVTVGPTGRIVVGGAFTYSGSTYALNAAHWDGSNWQPMTTVGVSHRVDALATLPNGDVIAGGRFTSVDQMPAKYLARWDGTQWSSAEIDVNGFVEVLKMFEGELMVAGPFDRVGSDAVPFWGRYVTPCAATASSYGAGCVGSAGLNELVAATDPWLGTSFESLASGLPAASLAVAAYGFAMTQVPLNTILSQGTLGCDLLAIPVLLDAFLPVAGSATLSLDLPSSVSLAGLSLVHQAFALELDASGNLVAVTSTNGLSLVLGSY